jgi:hypothetical protein
MKKVRTITAIVALLYAFVASAENKQTPKGMGKIELLPKGFQGFWIPSPA